MTHSSRLTAVLLSAAAVLGAVAVARAAEPGAPRSVFSALEPPRTYLWGDCRIRVGPGFDTARAGRPDWRVLGAGEVDCSQRHLRIAISVRELRIGGGSPVVVGDPGERTVSGASTGFVPTGPACRDGHAAAWQTRVRVTVDGWSSAWLDGDWSRRRTDGCGPR